MRVSRNQLARGGRSIWPLIDDAIENFTDHGGTTLGAAVAFYALLSTAPLLVLSISIAGAVWDRGAARMAAIGWVAQRLGHDVATAVVKLMEATRASSAGEVATVLGALVLFWAASRTFVQIQEGLNAIWGIRRRRQDKLRGKLGSLIKKRLVSFAMVVACGLLLGLSLILQSSMSVAESLVVDFAGFGGLWQALRLIINLAIFTALFALLYRVLPDARLSWRDVWVGAAFTAFAVGIGILLTGLYMGYVSVESTYGAAGSLVLLVLWIYYSSLVFFFGASFTRAWASQYGKGVRPEPHAVRVFAADDPGAEEAISESRRSMRPKAAAKGGGASTSKRR